jgi:hypothetical protein
MGFLDKAKKMAEQAQAKLDEAQKQFNTGQGEQRQGPVVEYDKHGRPIPSAPPATATPPQGDPLAGAAEPAAATTAPTPDPSAPAAPADEARPQGDPLADATPAPDAEARPAASSDADAAPDAPPARPTADAPPEDRNHPSYARPKLTSGDPLAG